MNLEKIGNVVLSIYDELIEDPKSESIIEALDSAQEDKDLLEAIKSGIARIEKLGKKEVANKLKEEIGL